MPAPHKRTECHDRRCVQDECVDFRAELEQDAKDWRDVEDREEEQPR